MIHLGYMEGTGELGYKKRVQELAYYPPGKVLVK
jgi:hypothetical protein